MWTDLRSHVWEKPEVIDNRTLDDDEDNKFLQLLAELKEQEANEGMTRPDDTDNTQDNTAGSEGTAPTQRTAEEQQTGEPEEHSQTERTERESTPCTTVIF